MTDIQIRLIDRPNKTSLFKGSKQQQFNEHQNVNGLLSKLYSSKEVKSPLIFEISPQEDAWAGVRASLEKEAILTSDRFYFLLHQAQLDFTDQNNLEKLFALLAEYPRFATSLLCDLFAEEEASLCKQFQLSLNIEDHYYLQLHAAKQNVLKQLGGNVHFLKRFLEQRPQEVQELFPPAMLKLVQDNQLTEQNERTSIIFSLLSASRALKEKLLKQQGLSEATLLLLITQAAEISLFTQVIEFVLRYAQQHHMPSLKLYQAIHQKFEQLNNPQDQQACLKALMPFRYDFAKEMTQSISAKNCDAASLVSLKQFLIDPSLSKNIYLSAKSLSPLLSALAIEVRENQQSWEVCVQDKDQLNTMHQVLTHLCAKKKMLATSFPITADVKIDDALAALIVSDLRLWKQFYDKSWHHNWWPFKIWFDNYTQLLSKAHPLFAAKIKNPSLKLVIEVKQSKRVSYVKLNDANDDFPPPSPPKPPTSSVSIVSSPEDAPFSPEPKTPTRQNAVKKVNFPSPALYSSQASSPEPALYSSKASSPEPASYSSKASSPEPALYSSEASSPEPALYSRGSSPSPASYSSGSSPATTSVPLKGKVSDADIRNALEANRQALFSCKITARLLDVAKEAGFTGSPKEASYGSETSSPSTVSYDPSPSSPRVAEFNSPASPSANYTDGGKSSLFTPAKNSRARLANNSLSPVRKNLFT